MAKNRRPRRNARYNSKRKGYGPKKRKAAALRRFIPGQSRIEGMPARRFLARVGAEQKYKDTFGPIHIRTTAWGDSMQTIFASLNLIGMGITATSRIGQKVGLTKIDYDFDLANLKAAENRVLIIIVLDTQCNGTAATADKVYDYGASTIGAFRNIEYTHRFRVLKRLDAKLSPIDLDGSAKKYRGVMKVNLPIIYDNSNPGGAIGNVKSNNIFVIAAASQPGIDPTTGSAAVTCNFRLRYTDA